ncbi:MAG: hypothetical protein ABII27_07330 [bacterium]
MKSKLFVTTITFVCSVNYLFASPINFDGGFSLGPQASAYSDYQGQSVHSSDVDVALKTWTSLFTDSNLRFEYDTQKETIFAPVRENILRCSYNQDFGKKTDFNFKYFLDYWKTTNDYEIRSKENFNNSNFRFGFDYNPFNFLTTYFRVGLIDKSVSFVQDSFSMQEFEFGNAFWLNNRKDNFDLNLHAYSKDAELDTRDFDKGNFNFSYFHSFDNLDEAGGSIEFDETKYDETAEVLDSTLNSLSVYYSDEFVNGNRYFGLNLVKDDFDYDKDRSYDEYAFTYNSKRYETRHEGEYSSNHRISHFNNKRSRNNDYIEWMWDYERFTKTKKLKKYYINNKFVSRFWGNYQESDLKENFIEDTIGSGINWSSFYEGFMKVGAFIGERIYFNPIAKTNSIPDDNSYMANPNNFFLYGFNVDGVCSPIEDMELALGVNYKKFTDYNSKPNTTRNELVELYIYLVQNLNEHLRLINRLNYSSGSDDDGIQSHLASRFNFFANFEYSFNVVFLERKND